MVVVLSEASHSYGYSLSDRELQHISEVATLLGCRTYFIPRNFDICETAENALAHVPTFEAVEVGIWVGYIPTVARYAAIYEAALARNIKLINSPDEYQRAMHFDRFYPLLADLTPKSRIVTNPQELTDAVTELGFPLFVKGAVKSNKELGWSACVAQNMSELTAIAETLRSRPQKSLGCVILRELVPLRIVATDLQGFRFGREYRVFIYQQQVLACGFYWEEYSDKLSVSEEKIVLHLAIEAARRVGTPFIAVDVGQLENGEWIAIEVGDGQFCGLSRVPMLELWSQLKEISEG